MTSETSASPMSTAAREKQERANRPHPPSLTAAAIPSYQRYPWFI
jgi:hypothetical protein